MCRCMNVCVCLWVNLCVWPAVLKRTWEIAYKHTHTHTVVARVYQHEGDATVSLSDTVGHMSQTCVLLNVLISRSFSLLFGVCSNKCKHSTYRLRNCREFHTAWVSIQKLKSKRRFRRSGLCIEEVLPISFGSIMI